MNYSKERGQKNIRYTHLPKQALAAMEKQQFATMILYIYVYFVIDNEI